MELPESGVKRTGAMLAAGRAAAGLEIADIARETRVPLRHLRALEADEHDSLPALPYAVGFVKSYARTVGLDPEALAIQFRAETTKAAHVPTPMSLEPLDERRLPSKGLVFASVGVVVLIIAGLSAWGSGAFDPAPVTEVAAVAQDASTDTGAVESTDPLVPAAPTAAAPGFAATPGAVVPAVGPVVLTAREDVWVQITDPATRSNIKVGILKTGESYSVPAATPGLQLRTGKAGALDVTVGGRAIPPLGGPVETIRDVSLAPADLAARAAATTAGTPAAAAGPRPIAEIPRPVLSSLPTPEPSSAPTANGTVPGV
ncbi:hypothetical protein GCM10011529_13840 [Polymorphobacter glacialis]|uniref:Cytoskeleton protein RodZ-like C-terminal domain-containing protein n=1 Tax=Sandarakinorhabdus glacialis TaxID=1614636 RepID=A0A916ZR41_9SPHN|nr:RodZ domain-containing protein [Polymorphobacter glacialis]GGE08642.1 hypothetical protein GCM10011529_13840 [Polymorphobacter glacialis]